MGGGGGEGELSLVNLFMGHDCQSDFDTHGGFLLWAAITLYCFWILAQLCDGHLTRTLDIIVEKLGIPEDVAGATFLAMSSSAPELFHAIVSTFVIVSSSGVGNVIGSALFNLLCILGVLPVCSRTGPLNIWWYPTIRDSCFYMLSIVELAVFITDERIDTWEAAVMVTSYVLYVVYFYFNQRIMEKLNLQPPGDECDAKAGAPAAEDDHCEGLPPIAEDSAVGRTWSNEDYETGGSAAVSPEILKLEDSPAIADRTQDLTKASAIIPALPKAAGASEAAAKTAKDKQQEDSADGLAQAAAAASPLGQQIAISVKEPNVTGCKSLEVESYKPMDKLVDLCEPGHGGRLGFPADHLDGGIEAKSIDTPGVGCMFPGGARCFDNRSGRALAPFSCLFCTGWSEKEPVEQIYEPSAPRPVSIPTEGGDQVVGPNSRTFVAEVKHASANPQDADDTEEAQEDGDDEMELRKCPAEPCMWLVDNTMPMSQSKVMLAFALVILWVGVFTYLMVDAANRLGCVGRVPHAVMGLTVLAAGTSVPDMIGSIAVARQGKPDMAAANAVGSNTFDILLGLGLPWLIRCATVGPIPVPSTQLLECLAILAVCLIAYVVALVMNGWVLNRGIGIMMLGVYASCIAFILVRQYTHYA
eukprot:TRINITY_DN93965_c0_g1_i1.p1 TRINITY_DN93965_c0_g1~~TRINITY_DN93965_c0_g1_i1.p1  ORF type:complete len:643 (-),score=119.79 TRINITY_DN93965_c0_g1_i1:281-2209(-)